MSAGGQASRAHLRRLATVPLALAACAGIAACGGSGHGKAAATITPTELVSRAVSASDTVSSGHIALAATLDLHGVAALGGKPVTIDVAGPFARGAGRAFETDLNATIRAGTGPANVALDIVGGRAYLGAGGSFYELRARGAPAGHWIAGIGATGATNAAGALATHVRGWLEDPHVVGAAAVGGVATQHLTARLNVAAVVGELTKLLAHSGAGGRRAGGATGTTGASGRSGANGATGASGANGATGATGVTSSRARGGAAGLGVAGGSISASTLLPLLEQAITSARVDIYTGTSDHIVRELDLSIDFSVPALASGLLGGLTGGSLDVVATLTAVNVPQTISAPPNPQPASKLLNGVFALESELGSLSSLFAGSGSLVG
jgi:hypothetical protein